MNAFIQNNTVSFISEHNSYGGFTNIQLSEVFWFNAFDTLHIEVYHNDLDMGTEQLNGVYTIQDVPLNYLIIYKI